MRSAAGRSPGTAVRGWRRRSTSAATWWWRCKMAIVWRSAPARSTWRSSADVRRLVLGGLDLFGLFRLGPVAVLAVARLQLFDLLDLLGVAVDLRLLGGAVLLGGRAIL